MTARQALERKLELLQPSVINYNPSSVEDLSKAVSEATAQNSRGEVGGPLPKLLKDVDVALAKTKKEQKELELRLKAVDRVKERAARRADSLTQILLRSAPSPRDKAQVLFSELRERTELAVDEAVRKGEGGEGDGDGSKWRETLDAVEKAVVDELRDAAERESAAVERNATLTGQLAAATARAEAAEAAVAQLRLSVERLVGERGGAASPTAASDAADVSRLLQLPAPAGSAAGAAEAAAAGAGAAGVGATTPTTSAFGIGGLGTPVPEAGGALSGASAPPSGSVTLAASVPQQAQQQQSLPLPVASGACVGKKCPAGYEMIDRGDRCSCRPRPEA